MNSPNPIVWVPVAVLVGVVFVAWAPLAFLRWRERRAKKKRARYVPEPGGDPKRLRDWAPPPHVPPVGDARNPKLSPLFVDPPVNPHRVASATELPGHCRTCDHSWTVHGSILPRPGPTGWYRHCGVCDCRCTPPPEQIEAYERSEQAETPKPGRLRVPPPPAPTKPKSSDPWDDDEPTIYRREGSFAIPGYGGDELAIPGEPTRPYGSPEPAAAPSHVPHHFEGHGGHSGGGGASGSWDPPAPDPSPASSPEPYSAPDPSPSFDSSPSSDTGPSFDSDSGSFGGTDP